MPSSINNTGDSITIKQQLTGTPSIIVKDCNSNQSIEEDKRKAEEAKIKEEMETLTKEIAARQANNKQLEPFRVMVIEGRGRKHGFETPFGVFQVASWVVAAYILISTCLTVAALL